MIDKPTSYPLAWPHGWQRTPPASRLSAKFDPKGTRTVAQAVEFLMDELRRLRASDVVISTNIQPRLDKLPRSGEPQPQDTGVAVYFVLKGRQQVLACDGWRRVQDNLWSIAKHIEMLRGIDRYKVGTLEQAFMGYKRLAAGPAWHEVLQVSPMATVQEVDAAHQRLALDVHPDRGGNDSRMAELNTARDEGRRARGAG